MNIELFFDPKMLILEPEKRLFEAYIYMFINYENFIENKEYFNAVNSLNYLIEPISTFFEEIHVNDKNEKIKHNRLGLLKNIKQLYDEVANFKKLIK
jgi:glycyl-tRNA synthetase beta chain